MARESDEGRASDAAIDRLVEALDERNDHLSGVIEAANRVDKNVDRLRTEVFARPKRDELAHRRRMTVMLLVLFTYALLLVSDLNVNACSPGHKAGIIVDELAKGRVKTEQDYTRLADRRLSPACDVLFPLHRHDGRDHWPTNGNTLGIVLIASLTIVITTYARGPRGWEPRKEPVEGP